MSGIVIVPHHERSEAVALARVAASWAAERGHEVWVPTLDADLLGLVDLADDRPAAEASLVLSLGGDGTVLRAVQMLGGAPVPVIGVNVGVLGYLTEVEPPALPDALAGFFAGEHAIDERMLLEIELDGTRGPVGTAGRWRALNEAVVEKYESGHTIRLLVRIDGAPFTSYAADGLIVATPTGSTAYSLSARGPVASPRLRAMLVTPVSPHMLFDRSLVLDPDELVEVELLGHRPAVLAVDGRRVATLTERDTVRCRPSPDRALFVRFGGRRFHQILKAKFGLMDR